MSEVADYTKERVERAKERMPLEKMIEAAERMVSSEVILTGAYMGFREALERKGLSVIGEVRIPDDGESGIHHLDQASAYEWADASAITIPTEPRWLNGSDSILLEARNDISIPLVRRDFVVDAYQIYEAKYLGSDGLTIDASLIDNETMQEMLSICKDLFIDALVEVHDASSLAAALGAGADIIGMELNAFKAVLEEMESAAPGTPLVPEECLLVVGPGITSLEDARYAREHGADAVMAGTMFACMEGEDERQEAIRAMSEID